MDIRKEIKILATKEATSLTEIASKLYSNKERRKALNLFTQKLRNNTIRFQEVSNVLDILGYQLTIEKKK